MIVALASLLDSIANSGWMIYIRDSSYGMPALQSVHLVGLTILLAAILVLNLRLVSVSMLDWPLPSLVRQLKPWAVGALIMMIASGIMMFLGNPTKYLASYPFQFKMTALALAILFQFGTLQRLSRAQTQSRPRRADVIVAGVSLTLWFTVGWAGRAIAFV
jgi:uncharacterized integral membrane protein